MNVLHDSMSTSDLLNYLTSYDIKGEFSYNPFNNDLYLLHYDSLNISSDSALRKY